jgi:hypothetical protein
VNCERCEQAFGAAIEGILDGDASDELAVHLAACPSCRDSFDQTRRLVSRLRGDAKGASTSSMAASVADRIIQEQAFQLRRIAAMRRTAIISAAAVLLVGIAILANPFLTRPGGEARADDLKSAGEAMGRVKTAAWKTSYYMRFLAPDGKKSRWVRVANNDQRFFYRSPGLYRREGLDESGKVVSVAIEDVTNRGSLEIDPVRKVATIRYLAEPSYSPSGPFATFTETMKNHDLQGLGKKDVDGKPADGYRYKFFAEGANQDWSYELWIDSKNKRLVAGQVPGGDIFDLSAIVRDRTWEPAMKAIEVEGTRFELASDLGIGNSSSLVHEIILDTPLDESLFRIDPPEGYAIETVPIPPVAEKDVIEFLGILARYFDRVFPDRAMEFSHGPAYQKFERIERDVLAKKGGTDAEVAMVEAMHKWWRAGLPGPGPLHLFVTQQVERGSWKYLGEGVKLGDKDRIVCWYRPKGSRTYHVVYGDLSMREVVAGDLPLPVGR